MKLFKTHAIWPPQSYKKNIIKKELQYLLLAAVYNESTGGWVSFELFSIEMRSSKFWFSPRLERAVDVISWTGILEEIWGSFMGLEMEMEVTEVTAEDDEAWSVVFVCGSNKDEMGFVIVCNWVAEERGVKRLSCIDPFVSPTIFAEESGILCTEAVFTGVEVWTVLPANC